MKGKGKSTIRLAMKELRSLIDSHPDPVVQRIAYGMETAIAWATRDTVGWKRPAAEAKILAEMLREELKLSPQYVHGSKG